MSDEPIIPRVPKPESLEAKFKLLTMLPYDRRAKRKHSLVFGFVLDWYHSKYGDALASVRHIGEHLKQRDPAGVGMFTGDVHSALTDLVAWGFLSQQKGSGRRASRYVPNWDLVCSVRKIPNTTEDGFSVRETTNADVRETPNATGDSVRDSMNEDPSTRTRPQDEGTGIDGQKDCAAPTAPLMAVLSPANAGTAQGFEDLWCAYDFKKKRKEARVAFAKLAPDAELLASMIASAAAWRESWAAQGNPNAPRFHLHKWIEREEYRCDAPTGYKPKEAKPRLATAETAARQSPALKAFVPRRELVRITDSEITQQQFNRATVLSVDFVRQEDGEPDTVSFALEHKDPKVQADGQQRFGRLLGALGLTEGVDDSSQLHGLLVVRTIDDAWGQWDFEPAPANDNDNMREAVA